MSAHAPVAHVAHAHARPVQHLDRRIAGVINRARRFVGLRPLRFNGRLSRAAHAHSADLMRHNMLSHNSSNGTPFYFRVRRATPARSVGETIALFRGHTTATAVVNAWINSPAHRAELFSRAYSRVGVGRVRRHGVSFITADFASAR
jgi:uncharacterized protein YkwD